MAKLIDAYACPCLRCNTKPHDCYTGYCEEFTRWRLSPLDAVEVPCKIGDRVWVIRNYKGRKQPQEGIVSEMYFTDDMRLNIVVKHIARGEWGRTIFATFDEAVAEILGERKGND